MNWCVPAGTQCSNRGTSWTTPCCSGTCMAPAWSRNGYKECYDPTCSELGMSCGSYLYKECCYATECFKGVCQTVADAVCLTEGDTCSSNGRMSSTPCCGGLSCLNVPYTY